MEELYPNIFLLPDEFSVGYSYLITRPQGNLLIPNGLETRKLSGLIEELDSKGGVSAVLACCKHNVKVRSRTAEICEHYGAPLYISAPNSRGNTISQGRHVHALSFQTTDIEPDLRFLPLAGYTDGSCGYLWQHGERSYLFTGVTLVHNDKGWKVWTAESRAAKCIAAFERIRMMNFDVMFVNSFSNTRPTCYEWTPEEKDAVIDEAVAQVRAL